LSKCRYSTKYPRVLRVYPIPARDWLIKPPTVRRGYTTRQLVDTVFIPISYSIIARQEQCALLLSSIADSLSFPVLPSLIAVVASSLLAFLVLIVYTVDGFVKWWYLRERLGSYLAVQEVVVISIRATKVVLVVLRQRNGIEPIVLGLPSSRILHQLLHLAITYTGHFPRLSSFHSPISTKPHRGGIINTSGCASRRGFGALSVFVTGTPTIDCTVLQIAFSSFLVIFLCEFYAKGVLGRIVEICDASMLRAN
jgi:hypothetical protein